MNARRPRLAFCGDDFTGSTDALEQLARAGLRTALFLEPPTPAQLAAVGPLDAIGVAGLTRSLAPGPMEAALRPALEALRRLGPDHLHYKVCSTFDSSPAVGSIGRALEIGAEVCGAPWVPVIVGAPALGRWCVFGHLFARFGIGSAGAIHRLDRHPAMQRHPVTPMDESDLLRHLARQTTRRGAVLDVLALEEGPTTARAALDRLVAAGAEHVLCDTLTEAHLLALGTLLEEEASARRPVFIVGSSGVEAALCARWRTAGSLPVAPRWPRLPEAGPLLVVSGSRSPVTAGQIAWAVGRGFAEVTLTADDVAGAAGPSRAAAAAIAHLQAGRSVVVHSGRGPEAAPWPGEAGSARVLGAALGRIARDALAAVPLLRIVIAGGDSSSHAARALGLEAVEMAAPLAPGAPWCRARAPGSPADGRLVNFKGGQVGAEDYFGRAAAGETIS